MGCGSASERRVDGAAAVLRSLSPVSAGCPSCEILDGRVCGGYGQVGHGSARRAGRTGRAWRGTLASGNNDFRDLGGNVASPDPGWTGSDGTEAGTPIALPTDRKSTR